MTQATHLPRIRDHARRRTAREAARRDRRRWLMRVLSGAQSFQAAKDATLSWSNFGAVPSSPYCGAPPSCAVIPGAVHAHTRHSDGSGTVSEVVAAARRAGVSFLIISDHDTHAAALAGWEGNHTGLVVLVGSEIKTDSGYLLGLGLPPHFDAGTKRAERVLDAIAECGGMAFAALPAHPFIGWKEWNHPALVGLEVLNMHSLGRQAACPLAVPGLLGRLALGRSLEGLCTLARHPAAELRLWDSMLERGRAVGLASADAHGPVRLGKWSLPFPAYEDSFRLVQTHLVLPAGLTGDFRIDRDRILAALRNGNCRSAYSAFGEATRYAFWHEGSQTRRPSSTALEGEAATAGGVLHVRSPHQQSLHRLIRDGQVVGQTEGVSATFPCETPGAYRVESFLFRGKIGSMRLGVRPWIYTNPIYLDATTRCQRSASGEERTTSAVPGGSSSR